MTQCLLSLILITSQNPNIKQQGNLLPMFPHEEGTHCTRTTWLTWGFAGIRTGAVYSTGPLLYYSGKWGSNLTKQSNFWWVFLSDTDRRTWVVMITHLRLIYKVTLWVSNQQGIEPSPSESKTTYLTSHKKKKTSCICNTCVVLVCGRRGTPRVFMLVPVEDVG